MTTGKLPDNDSFHMPPGRDGGSPGNPLGNQPLGPDGERKKILFISNGHGEDSIAVKIIRRLRDRGDYPADVEAWPMVGEGAQYRQHRIPTIGPPNLLPSCGFATLSWKWMLRDLRAGWISTHWRQLRAALGLKKKYSLVAAVGDIVVIGAAVLAKTPFFFVGCAKSSYYSSLHGYTRLEKYLLKRHCRLTFPRDRLTVEELELAGVAVRYVGNPMMDDLADSGDTFAIPPGTEVVALLPGSRPDAANNALHMLTAISRVEPSRLRDPVHFLFAAPDNLDLDIIREEIGRGDRAPGWEQAAGSPRRGIVLELQHRKGIKAGFAQGRFADVLHRSSIAVGTAGTANEQAVGLGKPLITFPTPGVMGPQYVNMKMKFFGPSALEVSPEPGEIAHALVNLLRDKGKRERMAGAGRERMGKPGASQAIAEEIGGFLWGKN